jgi:hypothetical protein
VTGRNSREGGPAQWGATVALIVFVVLAAAGHKEIGAMLHVVLTVVEIAVFSVAGFAVLAAAVVIIRARRRAAWRARARRAPVHVSRIRLSALAGDDRPALDAPRPRAARWPLPGQWREITPGNDHRKEN